jgi:hypothetical protein
MTIAGNIEAIIIISIVLLCNPHGGDPSSCRRPSPARKLGGFGGPGRATVIVNIEVIIMIIIVIVLHTIPTLPLAGLGRRPSSCG